jgi:hypothetical protein
MVEIICIKGRYFKLSDSDEYKNYNGRINLGHNKKKNPRFSSKISEKLGMGNIRPFLCFSLFCVRVGFEQQKLENKQKKISIKMLFYEVLI